jgi:hypothetical protein
MVLMTPVKERPVLDLNYIHFDHKIRDIRVIGSWIFVGSKDPCLVLLPVGRNIQLCQPCVVPLESAFLWAEETCDPIECAQMALGFADNLGKNFNNTSHILQIIGTVRQRLHDLITMPPAPRRPLLITGHVTISHENEIVSQKDVLDDV